MPSWRKSQQRIKLNSDEGWGGMKKKGLLIVYTGTGKGKTIAAMGMAMRALGHEMPVCVIKFVKGTWLSGELEAAKKFGRLFEFHVMGNGFIWGPDNRDKHVLKALEAWTLAEKTIRKNRHRLVVLDELILLMREKFLCEEIVLQCLRNRPQGMHVVVTGRDAGRSLIESADLVSVVCNQKHPIDEGIYAQKGIDY
jgi:cob(I)alamin adenosyltransferase